MSAQPGAAVLLLYGPQGAQQPGAGVLLSYTAPAAIGVMRVVTGLCGAWLRAARAIKPLDVPQPATAREDHATPATWVAAAGLDNEDGAAWRGAARTDDGRRMPFGAAGDALDEGRGGRWGAARSADDDRCAPWATFGDILAEDRCSRWKGSASVDSLRLAPWGGFLIPVMIPVPYLRPAGNAANFSPFGDGITAFVPVSAYTSPGGNAILFQLGTGTYRPPYYRSSALAYHPPAGAAADFLYAPALVPDADEEGNPIVGPASRDAAGRHPWGAPVERDVERVHPWARYSRLLNPGWGIVVPGTPMPTPGESIIIPVRRVYLVINETQLIRVAGAVPITTLTMNVGFDCDSWLPSFSAAIPESARAAVMPDPNPVEVEAVINGVQFRFYVERVQRNRLFAQNAVTISGRGIACELDAPYATAAQHINGSAMTAQQLIDAALAYSSYTQTWAITDWPVPAAAFSLYGTPADVAANVADAAGAVLTADWAARDLRMLPRYPKKPWEWHLPETVPDFVIPSAVAQSEGLEWVEKPAYNVVYVSGVQAGVLGQVKITGTAGDKPAPMVTHPLITHDDAARQKGTSILSDTGRKAMMQISLPVLDETGVIDVCKLIEFHDGASVRRGLVRANNIAVNFPSVRQTLTIEATA